jgi:hypothetical protein
MSDAVAAIVGAATGAVITVAGVIVQIASGNRATNALMPTLIRWRVEGAAVL